MTPTTPTGTPPSGEAGMTNWQRKTLHWLANGDTGLSSETMAFWLAFAVIKRWGEKVVDHPSDPADFDRCLRLLAEVPELRPKLPLMARLSPVWSRLVARWEEIERCHLEEVGLGWSKAKSAPKTFKLMKEVIGE